VINKVSRREFSFRMICGIVFAILGSIVFALSDALKRQKIINRKLVEKDDPLVSACFASWNENGNYKPSLNEVKDWIDIIKQNDRVINDTLFYVAIIDHESLGDPTSYVKKYDTRGLGHITRKTAEWILRKYNMMFGTIGTALFIPSFNIRIMIMLIEYYYLESKIKDRVKWALLCYGKGREGAKTENGGGENYYKNIVSVLIK